MMTRVDSLQVTYEITSNEIDFHKNKIALMPNFIHYLGSVIMIKTVGECLKRGISILPVHDCFYVDKEHFDELRQIYSTYLFEIAYKSEPLKNLAYNNNASEYVKKEIDEIDDRAKNNYKSFEVMISNNNPNILRPE